MPEIVLSDQGSASDIGVGEAGRWVGEEVCEIEGLVGAKLEERVIGCWEVGDV